MKLVARIQSEDSIPTSHREAKVYLDKEWNEYRVKFFQGGKYLRDADYNTLSDRKEDKQDALDTAKQFVG
jgi:hypothetical protein